MLTARGFCIRAATKTSPLFHKTRILFCHGENFRTFRAAKIQRLNHFRGASSGGAINNRNFHKSTHNSQFTNTLSIYTDSSRSPFSCQRLRILRESGSNFFGSTTSGVSRPTAGGHYVRTIGTATTSEKNARLRLTALRLYRILQRLCGRLVPTSDGKILLQNDISASDWGHYHFHDKTDDGVVVTKDQTEQLIRLYLVLSGADPVAGISKENEWYDELKTMIPNILDKNTISRTCWTSPSNLQEAVRFAFRSSSSISSQSAVELQAMALRAIQIMEDQLKLWKQTSSASTSNGLVRVTATSRCLGTVSPVSMHASNSLQTPKYRFAYRIRVENISSSTTVQLLGRYWHISETDDNAGIDASASEPIEVDAPYTGAVGQLPVLQPGQVFEYVSGTDLTTPKGEMMGHLYMATVPPHTRSAKSGDTITAVTSHGSKGSRASSSPGTTTEDGNMSQTTLFHAAVKPFPLESFEK